MARIGVGIRVDVSDLHRTRILPGEQIEVPAIPIRFGHSRAYNALLVQLPNHHILEECLFRRAERFLAQFLLGQRLKLPGHEIQRLFGTREPTEEQLEVGRAALDEILRVEGDAQA